MLKIKNISKLNNLINSIARSYITKKETIIFKNNKVYSSILHLLSKLGIIKSFQELDSFLVIKLKSFNSLNKKISSVSLIKYNVRLSRKPTVSINELIALQRREGGTAFYILNTDKGILTSFDAILQNVGGFILFRVS